MPNTAGIQDHSGENAEKLAEGYKGIDRANVHSDFFAMLQQKAAEGVSLRILDIGSGAGNDAYAIAEMGHEVVGVEPSDLREIAIRDFSHDNIEYRDGMLPALDSVGADEQFDVVMMSAVWQYIDPAERADSLARISQNLAPNGTLYINYPSPPSREHQFEASPAMVDADIAAANERLPKGKKLSLDGEPKIEPDSRGRKSPVTGGDINFYYYTMKAGHAQSLGPREGMVRE